MQLLWDTGPSAHTTSWHMHMHAVHLVTVVLLVAHLETDGVVCKENSAHALHPAKTKVFSECCAAATEAALRPLAVLSLAPAHQTVCVQGRGGGIHGWSATITRLICSPLIGRTLPAHFANSKVAGMHRHSGISCRFAASHRVQYRLRAAQWMPANLVQTVMQSGH